MTNVSMRPPEVWGSAAQGTGESAQIGCVFCVGENTSAPALIVYYYQGTSMCQRHVLINVYGKDPNEVTS